MEYEKLYKLVDCEMEKVANKAELNDNSLSNLYRLVDVKKDLLEIEEKEMTLGYSNRGNSNGYSYGYRPMMPTYGSYSYRDGGRSNGYSMDEPRNNGSYQGLEDAMRHAGSDAEREAIRQVIDKYCK